jgi:transcriptional regulator with XRE-family HTH domain
MTSPTLARGLRTYGIGAKLRALRLRKKMRLVELGRHTGLSAAMLSKLERGQLFPTLPTLLRVALVYGVGLDHFFAAGAPRRALGIVRHGERTRLPERLGGRELQWEFECLDFAATERRLNAYWVKFHQPARPKVHQHDGAEFVHVLKGTLVMQVAGERHELDARDSIYFDPSQPHSYASGGSGPCEAVVITAP